MIISRPILLRMKNVSDKSCTECQNTLCVRQAYFRKTCSLCVNDEKTVEPERPQMATWRMRISRCVPQATNTHSQYVILIAFPLQQWFHERASMLHYTYIDGLVSF